MPKKKRLNLAADGAIYFINRKPLAARMNIERLNIQYILTALPGYFLKEVLIADGINKSGKK